VRHALGRRGIALAELRRGPVLFAFDFDGTLAPIVADRNKAAMRRTTRDLFARLCARFPCAVVSGRAREDVAERVAGLQLRHIVGSHGLRSAPGTELEQQIAAVRHYLASIPRARGVEIEDKRHSIALHYRRARDQRAARRLVATVLAGLPTSTRTLHGKFVVDILPADAPNKGDAIASIRAVERAERVVFVGDDRTDEDAFVRTNEVLGVRVGFARSSSASFFIRNQREIDRLLAWFISAPPPERESDVTLG